MQQDVVEDPEKPERLGGSAIENLEEENRKVIDKLTKNIIPLIWAINFSSSLMRVCLIYIHLVLAKDLNLSEYQYDIGSVIFPVPSNLILERLKMNMWIALLVCLWGSISMLSVCVSNAASLIAVRFCLGIAESGLAPDITAWFGERHRVRQLAIIQSAIPCSYAIAGGVSSIIFSSTSITTLALRAPSPLVLSSCIGTWMGFWGCTGGGGCILQLFIIYGLPTFLLSIVFYFRLPNTPNDASFLTDRDREVLVHSRAMAASVWSQNSANRTSRSLFWSTVLNSKNWMLAFCGMFAVGTITGVNGFVPAILYEAGSSEVLSNQLTLAIFALLFWSFHSAKKQERFWHAFIAMFTALITLGSCTLFVYLIDLSLVVVLLCIYECAMFAGYSIFIAEMANSVLGSTSIGIGLYYSVVGFGGWFGPSLMGFMRDLTGDNVVGLALMSASLGLSIGLYSIVHVTQRHAQIEVGSQMKLQCDTHEQSEGIKYEPKGGGDGAAIIV